MASPLLHKITTSLIDILLLDKIPNAVCAYSLFKLKKSATKCIRVRRSSDNAEIDIGFANNKLDRIELFNFITTNSGFVVTRYDQTGNGIDLTQSVAGNQPRIVNAGVFDESIYFIGASNHYMVSADSAKLKVTDQMSMLSVWQAKASQDAGMVGHVTSLDNTYRYCQYNYSSSSVMGMYLGTASGTSNARNTSIPYGDGKYKCTLSSYNKSLGADRLKQKTNNVDGISGTGYNEDIKTDGVRYLMGGKVVSGYYTGYIDTHILFNKDMSNYATLIYSILSKRYLI